MVPAESQSYMKSEISFFEMSIIHVFIVVIIRS